VISKVARKDTNLTPQEIDPVQVGSGSLLVVVVYYIVYALARGLGMGPMRRDDSETLKLIRGEIKDLSEKTDNSVRQVHEKVNGMNTRLSYLEGKISEHEGNHK